MDLRKIFAFCRGQIVIFVFVFIYILASVVVFFFFELAPRDFSPPRGRWDLAFIGRFVVCFPRRSGHQSLASGPPCGAAPFRARPYPPRLSQSPGVLSREFLPNFLPAGKDFTKWALHFLPVGNPGLRGTYGEPGATLLPRASYSAHGHSAARKGTRFVPSTPGFDRDQRACWTAPASSRPTRPGEEALTENGDCLLLPRGEGVEGGGGSGDYSSSERKWSRPNASPATMTRPSGLTAHERSQASVVKAATTFPVSRSHILRI